jgi:hypothetical protein
VPSCWVLCGEASNPIGVDLVKSVVGLAVFNAVGCRLDEVRRPGAYESALLCD